MKSKGQKLRTWRIFAVCAVLGLISCTVAFDLSSMSAGCGDGQKNCKGECVPDDNPLTGCAAEACESCKIPDHGYAVCDPDGVCDAGPNTCFLPYKDCNGNQEDGCETNTATNVDHCYQCNQPACDGGIAPAHADAACIGDPNVSNRCGIASCERGWGDCNNSVQDGCETNVSESNQHCGTCHHACAVGDTCTGGKCCTPDGTCCTPDGECCTPDGTCR